MTDAALGLSMLGLIVVVIMLGFPTAFTLMGLGMFFGFIAFYNPSEHWLDNRVFDLMVQRAYGAMTNETLLSIPLFVLMGYVMERGALVDKMFHSVRLAFRGVPGSLAVATLIICTFWGIASGLVGAVVVLMGVIAMRPMLNAGYSVKLASGVITAGGTLGILIPPSVMIIVYAAVAGQSVVKLYAAAMAPGFFLALLYLVYVIAWAVLRPQDAPRLPPEQQRAPVTPPVAHIAASYAPRMLPALLAATFAPGRALRAATAEARVSYLRILRYVLDALVPVLLAAVTLGAIWWYVTIYSQKDNVAAAPAAMEQADGAAMKDAAPGELQPPSTGLQEPGGLQEPPSAGPREPGGLQEPPGAGLQEPGGLQEPPGAGGAQESSTGVQAPPAAAREAARPPEGLQELGEPVAAPKALPVPEAFYIGFWWSVAVTAALLAWYYWRMDAEQFEILRMLVSSVMPLGVLTLVVLGVILFGITTATESAAVGAAGAFLMAWQARTLNLQRIKEAVFLTAKTTAMVCWLFVGSALFSAVFAILGGQQIIEHWVLGMNLSPLQFLMLSQAIIFVLGWPLEWTEIIVIFVPIFLPLLQHFQIDPLLFGTLVFVNLQAAFLSPPVAMSAFYLKGVSPPHVTLNQIFAGMMPYMLIVIVCMAFMYLWPGMTLWLPAYLYGG
jgi:TRAP-type mannitol/chloroaromatic compound transport system permease large subunit